MKEIQLTRGLVTQVDDEDFDKFNQFSWYAQKSKHTYYATRCVRIDGKKVRKYLHIEIMNAPKGMDVDHDDHNGLNNLRSNLKTCTRSQNQMNKNPKGKSKYLGVTIHKNKYIQAAIRIEGKWKYLGTFITEELAAKAYDEAAIIRDGEFANLNSK